MRSPMQQPSAFARADVGPQWQRHANARWVRRSLKEIARNQHRASGVQRRALPLPIKGSRTASK